MTWTIAQLATELQGGAYQGQSDAAALALIEALTIAGPNQDVPVGSVEGDMGLSGIPTAMEDWLVANPAPSQTRTVIKELLRTFGSQHVTVFEMSDPTKYAEIAGMLALLQAASLMTAGQVAAMLAKAATVVPEYPGATQHDIWVARGQPA